MTALAPLFASVRSHAPALLAQACEPQAELLAMIWGSRFDREHARSLIALHGLPAAQLEPDLHRAAESFDQLAQRRQQRLRQALAHGLARSAGATMAA